MIYTTFQCSVSKTTDDDVTLVESQLKNDYDNLPNFFINLCLEFINDRYYSNQVYFLEDLVNKNK